jgi:hypothetical protein
MDKKRDETLHTFASMNKPDEPSSRESTLHSNVPELLADKFYLALTTVSHFLTRRELSRKRAEKLWEECKLQGKFRWSQGREHQWTLFLGKLGEDISYILDYRQGRTNTGKKLVS